MFSRQKDLSVLWDRYLDKEGHKYYNSKETKTVECNVIPITHSFIANLFSTLVSQLSIICISKSKTRHQVY